MNPEKLKKVRENIYLISQHKVCMLVLLSRFSCVRLCATLWTTALQAPLSMGFCRQEYWNGLPFSSPIHTDIRVTSLLVAPDAPHFGTKSPECEGSW